MKYSAFALSILLAAVCDVSAQVTVELLPEQDDFMPDEAMMIGVRIVNHSGQTLHLGKDADWLTFDIESKQGFIVSKTGDVPVVQEFDLPSSKMATKHVDLEPYFNVDKVGRYTITATVRIKDWGGAITSDPKNIDVVPGVKLWEQEVGLPPASPGEHGEPEVRKYALEQTPYAQHMRLYLRLTDASESQVFKVFQLGPMLSFSRPEPQLDGLNNLHLLYQSGSHTFLYTVVNPQGTIVLRQTYDYASARPMLKEDKAGKIFVEGGIRKFGEKDIPRSEEPLPAVAPPTAGQ
jgi:hypothetical protein